MLFVKGKWQEKFNSFHLKGIKKQYIEVYYDFFISALLLP